MLAKHAGMDFYLQGKSYFARLARDHLEPKNIYLYCSRFQFAFEKELQMFVCKFGIFVAMFQCLF